MLLGSRGTCGGEFRIGVKRTLAADWGEYDRRFELLPK